MYIFFVVVFNFFEVIDEGTSWAEPEWLTGAPYFANIMQYGIDVDGNNSRRHIIIMNSIIQLNFTSIVI